MSEGGGAHGTAVLQPLPPTHPPSLQDRVLLEHVDRPTLLQRMVSAFQLDAPKSVTAYAPLSSSAPPWAPAVAPAPAPTPPGPLTGMGLCPPPPQGLCRRGRAGPGRRAGAWGGRGMVRGPEWPRAGPRPSATRFCEGHPRPMAEWYGASGHAGEVTPDAAGGPPQSFGLHQRPVFDGSLMMIRDDPSHAKPSGQRRWKLQ